MGDWHQRVAYVMGTDLRLLQHPTFSRLNWSSNTVGSRQPQWGKRGAEERVG
jgi:hypothetical protein